MKFRWWAFWRRVQYGSVCVFILIGAIAYVYVTYFIVPPSCFDGVQNGTESGIDCGGECVRICAAEVMPPRVDWAQSFEIVPGQYNAVAYVRNQNVGIGTPEVGYTMQLSDEQGVITEVTGTTVLPPDSVYPVFEGRIQTGNRIPTKTDLILSDASLWVPAERGAEQFTLVRRDFFDTSTGRPRLEAEIRNDAFVEAAEVEFVATVFDRDRRPLTASRTFVDEFAAESAERLVFTWPNPIASTIRSCEIPTDIVLAIDISGSMNDDQPDPPEPLTSVLAAADSFVSRLETDDQVGLITFATDAEVNNTLTTNRSSVRQQIRSLSIPPAEEVGFTNTGAAFVSGTAELTSGRANSNARSVLVILTDGLATAPEDDPDGFALEAAAQAKARGVEVYSIGLGESVNMVFVSQLASTPGQAYQALSASDVDAIYNTITASLCENGPAIMDIIPKTGANFVLPQ